MDRVVKDGHVAVLCSAGYGAGWYSWNQEYGKKLLFDPGTVDLVLAGKWEELESYLTLKYPGAYFGGVRSLDVVWVPVGTEFRIVEVDGAESIILKDEDDWIVA